MTPAALEALLRIALPPLQLALRVRYLEAPRDLNAELVVAVELAEAARIRAHLARQGWWN